MECHNCRRREASIQVTLRTSVGDAEIVHWCPSCHVALSRAGVVFRGTATDVFLMFAFLMVDGGVVALATLHHMAAVGFSAFMFSPIIIPVITMTLLGSQLGLLWRTPHWRGFSIMKEKELRPARAVASLWDRELDS